MSVDWFVVVEEKDYKGEQAKPHGNIPRVFRQSPISMRNLIRRVNHNLLPPRIHQALRLLARVIVTAAPVATAADCIALRLRRGRRIG